MSFRSVRRRSDEPNSRSGGKHGVDEARLNGRVRTAGRAARPRSTQARATQNGSLPTAQPLQRRRKLSMNWVEHQYSVIRLSLSSRPQDASPRQGQDARRRRRRPRRPSRPGAGGRSRGRPGHHHPPGVTSKPGAGAGASLEPRQCLQHPQVDLLGEVVRPPSRPAWWRRNATRRPGSPG